MTGRVAGGGTVVKKKKGGKLPPFVAMTWAMLNHKAYVKLPPTPKGMLPYFLGKVKIPNDAPTYYHAEFSFTFSEAIKYGCARRSFYRVIEALVGHGFVDPVRKGGRAGGRDTASVFRLSKRWQNFGTFAFEKVSWAEFGEAQIRKQVQKWQCPVAENEPGRSESKKQECQK
jgi:hypothetical protein